MIIGKAKNSTRIGNDLCGPIFATEKVLENRCKIKKI